MRLVQQLFATSKPLQIVYTLLFVLGFALDGMIGLSVAHAEAPTSLLELPIEELLSRKVDTASYLSSSWREQPGIITIFSASDIEDMNARTLRDVLLHIPGVSLGMDNHNAVGLVFRGNWSLEGKIQYVVNDIPVNDLIYGTFPIPPYLPAEQLDRVEVLRGPGSAKYGNSAQIAVIRIYTKQQQNDDQMSLSASGEKSFNTGIFSFNKRIQGEKSFLALAASANKGHWGDGLWTDALGTEVDVHSIDTRGQNLALDFNWDGTLFQIYYDNYDMDGVQQFGVYTPDKTVRFRQLNSAVTKEFSWNDRWKIRPRLSHRTESTWRSEGTDSTGDNVYDIRAERTDASLESTYLSNGGSQLTLGVLHESQAGRSVNVLIGSIDRTDDYLAPHRRVEYTSSALYGTWNYKISDYDLTFAGRAVNHSYAGSSITPRIGLTRTADSWHFKWLYGTAFREPNIEQIDTNKVAYPDLPSIKPEFTVVHELEWGRALNSDSYLTATLFEQVITDPIIYTPRGFTNNPQSKTRGAELQCWYRGTQGSVQGNLSWTRANDDDLPLYDVQGKSGQYIAAASQVASLWTSWKTGIASVHLLASAHYLGARTANAFDPDKVGGSGLPISQQALEPETVLNMGVNYQSAPFLWAFKIENLGDQRQVIPQPYNDISTPFPYGAREYWLRMTWNMTADER